MGLFRRGSSATREQLGAANVPSAHTADATVNGFDPREDEVATAGDERPRSFGERMRWRAAPSAPGPYVQQPGTWTGDEDGSQPDVHRSLGNADPRRVYNTNASAGYPGWVREEFHTPEEIRNMRIVEPVDAQAPWVRHRAGSTSDDPTRPAQLASWLYYRQFGTLDAERFTAIGRLEAASPLAASPLTPAAPPPSPYPNPGGVDGSPGFGPTVSAVANSWRSMPKPWDELVITTAPADTGQAINAARRASGWRLT